MSLVLDLATALEQGGAGTVGTDVFAGQLPDLLGGDPAAGVIGVLLSPASLGPVRTMGPSLTAPALEQPRVQVVTRAQTWQAAETKAALAMAALDNLGPVTLNGRLYPHVEAVQRPAFLLERDAQNRYVLAANFAVTRAA